MTEQEPLLLKAARVWSETGNYDKVAEATGLSKAGAKQAVEKGVQVLLRMREVVPHNNPSSAPPVVSIEAQEAASPEVQTLFERELTMYGIPIIQKIALNAKVRLYYDYMVNVMGFKGDVGDFLVDCVDDFFNSRGYSIKIIKEEIVK